MGSVTISWEMIWRLFFVALLGWLLFLARDVVAALLLAIVISTAFSPVVSFLERRRIPRLIGTMCMYLFAVMAIGFVLYLVVPVALSELQTIVDTSNTLIGSILSTVKVEGLAKTVSLNIAKLNDLLFSGTFSLIDLTSDFFGGVLFVLAVFFLSFYLTLWRDGVERFLIAILPSAYEERAVRLYARVSRKIGRWLTGQLLVSAIMGVAITIGLWLLGVRYSLFLGILAAVAEIVPYVGPIFTGALATIIGFTDSFSQGIYVLILFTVIQQIEGHVLIPSVMRLTTALNPAVILTALLIGGKVFFN